MRVRHVTEGKMEDDKGEGFRLKHKWAKCSRQRTAPSGGRKWCDVAGESRGERWRRRYELKRKREIKSVREMKGDEALNCDNHSAAESLCLH